MPLDAFALSNFKPFGPTQHIPLRRITLLYGANSVGKSSIIHALALAEETLTSGSPEVGRTYLGGDSIDLGGFRRYVHKHDYTQPVELTFELSSTRFRHPLHTSSRVIITSQIRELPSVYRVHDRYHKDNIAINSPGLGEFKLSVDGDPMLEMQYNDDGLLRITYLNQDSSIIAELVNKYSERARLKELPDESVLDKASDSIGAVHQGLFPHFHRSSPDSYLADSDHEQSLAVASFILEQGLEDLLRSAWHSLFGAIGDLTYLGPLRSIPPRHPIMTTHEDSPGWPRRATPMNRGDIVWHILRQNPALLEPINLWLGDTERTTTPYHLELRHLLYSETMSRLIKQKLRSTIGELNTDLIGAVSRLDMSKPNTVTNVLDSLNLDSLVELWITDLEGTQPADLQDLVLIDKTSGTTLSSRDVGIGISQVLPVLVLAFNSTESLITMEQPEIHLHPSLQADLGDLFIESALKESGNKFLIETHSEHLLLRILRRIRETSEGKLEGLPDVTPSDVSLLFVYRGSNGSRVVPIPITRDGRFAKRWPGGFFPERARELFS